MSSSSRPHFRRRCSYLLVVAHCFLPRSSSLSPARVCPMRTNLTAAILRPSDERVMTITVPMTIREADAPMTFAMVDEAMAPQFRALCQAEEDNDDDDERACVASGLRSLRAAIDHHCERQQRSKPQPPLPAAAAAAATAYSAALDPSCRVVLVSAYIQVSGYNPRGDNGERLSPWHSRKHYLERTIAQIGTSSLMAVVCFPCCYFVVIIIIPLIIIEPCS